MIIGDRTSLAFDVAPVEPTWDRRSPADRGPWARLSLWVNNRNITRVLDEPSDTVSNGVTVPVTEIARWMVRNAHGIVFEEAPAVARRYGNGAHEILDRWNRDEAPPGTDQDSWEDARYDWYCRHFWLAGAEGAMLPDLGLTRADRDLIVSWRHPQYPGPRQLTFLATAGCERVDWTPAWGALRQFVAWVATEVRQRDVDEGGWSASESPLEDAARCTPREFVNLVAPGAVKLLDRLHVEPGEDPTSRPSLLSLRDLEVVDDTISSVAEATEWMDRETEVDRETRLWELRSGAVMALGAAEPEAAGYDAARWLRSEMGLNGEPIDSKMLTSLVSDLAATESVRTQSVLNSAVIGTRRGRGAAVVMFVHDRTRFPWAERMEFARAIGHLVLDPPSDRGATGAASSLVAGGPRRRRAGAFAAELLLPSRHLATRAASEGSLASPTAFEQIMEQYGVGARTAAYHLWNNGHLKSEDERDWLIEEYGRSSLR
jgi:hypothetical protein